MRQVACFPRDFSPQLSLTQQLTPQTPQSRQVAFGLSHVAVVVYGTPKGKGCRITMLRPMRVLDIFPPHFIAGVAQSPHFAYFFHETPPHSMPYSSRTGGKRL